MKELHSSSEVRAIIESILNVRVGMKQFIQRKVKESGIDLTFEMLQVLTVLWRMGQTNQQDIADNIQKNKASLTSLLDNLNKRGLITRLEDPADRRNKIISLTPLGEEYRLQFEPAFDDFYSMFEKDLPKEKLRETSAVLNHIYTNLV